MLILLVIWLLQMHARAAPASSFSGPETSFFPRSAEVTNGTAFNLTADGSPTLDVPAFSTHDERALSEVIKSCVLTIITCVYRSMHPNVPPQDCTRWEYVRSRLRIALFALIAPELILTWAMRQWLGARSISRRINELDSELEWTTTHGHFLQMGGIGRKDTRETLSPEVFEDLLRLGCIQREVLLELKEDDIMDRSKGDFISKCFVVLQTSWFIIGCIARWSKDLPLTELEVITLAFAALNGFIHLLWWDKPQNVLRVTYLPIGHPTYPQGTNTGEKTNGSAAAEGGEEGGGGGTVTRHSASESLSQLSLDLLGKGVGATRSFGQTVIQAFGDLLYMLSIGLVKDSVQTIKTYREKSQTLGFFNAGVSMFIVQPVARFFASFLVPFVEMLCADKISSPFYAKSTTHAEDDPTFDLAVAVCSFVGLIFGGIHYLAWNAIFLSTVEKQMWRLCTAILIAVPTALLISVSDSIFMHFFGAPLIPMPQKMGRWVSAFIVYPTAVMGPVVYTLARVCLVVQALVTLRNPDATPGILLEVQWASLIPHT